LKNELFESHISLCSNSLTRCQIDIDQGLGKGHKGDL